MTVPFSNRYTPRTWHDGPGGGTPLTAADGMNRWEQGLEALDVGLDAAEDRLDALQAAVGQISVDRIPAGPTSQRPQPLVGRMFFDTTIGKPIIGNGTQWLEFGAGEVVEGPGSSTAPANFTAIVQTDNSIVCSWSPVSGASHYKLYEVRSPDGVDGATELTTTSSTRTPSSTGYYEYWVTAFVDGTESAQSEHGILSLPYGSDPEHPGDPGSGTGGTPAEVLALGAGGGDWNLGVGRPSGHVDISPSDLENGWSEAPYFYTTEDGAWVHFQVPMNGKTTSSGTKYPRSELREYINGSKASWNAASGTHVMSYRAKVIHMEDEKPECVIGQMHDGGDDTLQIRCEGTEWVCNINGETHSTSLGNFSWGTEVAVEIRIVNGTLTLKINGSTKITTKPGWGGSQYWKIGMYAQQNAANGNPSSGYASCEVRDLVVSHS